MISKVFTLYDSKAEVYLSPFLFGNKGEAIRAFTESLKNDQTPMSKYPQDFTLFMLGEYDNSSGAFMCGAPVSLGNGLEFLPVISKEKVVDISSRDLMNNYELDKLEKNVKE